MLIGSCSSSTLKPADVPAPDPSPTTALVGDETVVPDEPKSNPDFHESLDEIAVDAKLEKLRELRLADKDIEVRIWGGFGLTGIDLFILSRTDSTWRARKIRHVSNGESQPNKRRFRVDQVEITQPSKGWDAAWQDLLRSNLLTLPDASSINCEARYNDGYSYVVEIRKGANYRTYAYDNPDADFKNRCKEADEILAIATIIRDQYGGL